MQWRNVLFLGTAEKKSLRMGVFFIRFSNFRYGIAVLKKFWYGRMPSCLNGRYATAFMITLLNEKNI